jgi:hypothetical protein
LWSRSEQKNAKIPPPLGATTKLDFVFTRPGTPNVDSLFTQPLENGSGIGQVIQLYEHVHGIRIHSAPQSIW